MRCVARRAWHRQDTRRSSGGGLATSVVDLRRLRAGRKSQRPRGDPRWPPPAAEGDRLAGGPRYLARLHRWSRRGPGGAPGFEDKLRSLLDALIESGGPIAKLRLRLLCRTAEWTESLEQSLGSLWVEAEVKKLQISPLLEADVREAVQVSTGDSHKAASFLESVKQLRIEALASRPVSLKLLIELFIEFGNLPRRQAELYQRGLQALLAGSHRGDPTWARRGRWPSTSE